MSALASAAKKRRVMRPRGSAVCTLSNELVFIPEQKLQEREVFVVQGDRTVKSGRGNQLWSAWKAEWHGVPHNLYMISGPLRIPPQGVKAEEGLTYSLEACGRAMARHALAKSWVWTGFSNASDLRASIDLLVNEKGEPDKAARKAYACRVSIPKNELMAFVSMCQRFTTWCERGSVEEFGEPGLSHLLTEMVMGGIKKTSNAKRTAVEEAFEEGCIDKTFANANLQDKGLVEYTSRGRTSYSAAFLLLIPKAQMAQWLAVEEASRVQESNWFGAHAWYAYLPGIHVEGMDKVKERHETRNRRFVSLAEARQLLDVKNLGILEHVLAHM